MENKNSAEIGTTKPRRKIKPTMLSKVKNRQELRDSYLRRKKTSIEDIVSVLVSNMITELTKEIEDV